MSSGESAGFEHGEGSYFQAPSPKRVHFDHSNGDAPEVMQVSEVVETVHTGDPNEVDTVTITVPSSQFEIEINSQVDEDEGEEVPQIQRSDLTGPAFGIVRDPQEPSVQDLSTLEEPTHQSDDGGTLNAIGRALLQMQQGNQPPQVSPSSNQQIFFTRPSESDSGSQSAPLYVMIPPASSAEILQAMGQTRPIAPKTSSSPPMSLHIPDDTIGTGGDMKTREAQRKATHNEVERRRRDRINELIKMLAMIVPGCQKKDATTGTIVGYVYSKGTVLDKTVEYLKELITQNEQLAGTAKLAEKSANALSLLQNQITVLEKENAFLRAQIIQFGIDAAASNSHSANVNRQILNTPLAQSLLNTVAQASQQAAAPPPAPPPPLPQNPVGTSTQATAQQLLISLAQSLTNSPLLTSPPSQTAVSTVTSSPSHLPPSLSATSTPARLPPSVQSASPITAHQPQGNTLAGPLLSSLVQTLASLATTTAPPPPPPPPPKPSPPPISTTQPQTPPQAPPPTSGGLSAAAAASLLNTLIMAQNVLTNTSTGPGGGPSVSEAVLHSMGLEAVSRGEQ